MKPQVKQRSDYLHFAPITTRWSDNDAYGHVNNVVYYSWFDTVVNQFLIAGGALDVGHSDAIGLVVETHCNYFEPISFPEPVIAGLTVASIGSSSVRYEIGIFRADRDASAAHGHFVHVYVDRVTRRPCAIPTNTRELLNTISLKRRTTE